MFAPQILRKLLLQNALGNMQTSQEYFTTIVYAKFGGQTECIMDNWKIVNGQDTSNTTIHDGSSVFLTDFERFNDLTCLMLWDVVM